MANTNPSPDTNPTPNEDDFTSADGGVELTPEEEAEYYKSQNKKPNPPAAKAVKSETYIATEGQETFQTSQRPSLPAQHPTHYVLQRADAAPRYELTEPVFRKYEPYIIKAMLQHETVFDPLELKIRPGTFISRMRDAILGFVRYSYKSAFLSPTMHFRYLKYTALIDGRVLVTNTTLAPGVHLQNSYEVCSENYEAIDQIITNLISAQGEWQTAIYYLIFRTPEQESYILNLIKRSGIGANKTNICTYAIHS